MVEIAILVLIGASVMFLPSVLVHIVNKKAEKDYIKILKEAEIKEQELLHKFYG